MLSPIHTNIHAQITFNRLSKFHGDAFCFLRQLCVCVRLWLGVWIFRTLYEWMYDFSIKIDTGWRHLFFIREGQYLQIFTDNISGIAAFINVSSHIHFLHLIIFQICLAPSLICCDLYILCVVLFSYENHITITQFIIFVYHSSYCFV